MEKSLFKERILSLRNKYHIHHPFHKKMNSGKISKEGVQLWVANRYYYQKTIPRKDSAILMNCDSLEIRKEWIKRIIDHDENGGIEAWQRLATAVGLNKEILESEKMVLPGVRFAVDSYFNFCVHSNYKDSMTSSLTELFAPEIHQVRLKNWPMYYPWIDQAGYDYFTKRLSEAKRDVDFTLNHTLDNYITLHEQNKAIGIIEFKLNVLWCMLDSINNEYNNI
jgi:pyrroloquinoline-quinone synthase